jgi:branched-chain amino acid transport system ATP-binding protein
MSESPPLLEVRALEAHYGPLQALFGVDLTVERGSITAVLGNNGAGKSTLLQRIMGLIPSRSSGGSIRFDGRELLGTATERIVRLGISYVPEGRHVFPDLTVRQNLRVGAFIRRDRAAAAATLERVFDLFPLLAEREDQPAGTLSGGEQQMLAIGRALLNGPELLLLDEPSLGLAPILVHQVFDIIDVIRSEGVSVLLVEQNARMALRVADFGVVMERGRVSLSGPAVDLIDNPEVEELYMGSANPLDPRGDSDGA